VKEPMQVFAGLTWTGLDVGGPCLETFGMNIREDAPANEQGRELQEAASGLTFKWVAFCHAIGCRILSADDEYQGL